MDSNKKEIVGLPKPPPKGHPAKVEREHRENSSGVVVSGRREHKEPGVISPYNSRVRIPDDDSSSRRGATLANRSSSNASFRVRSAHLKKKMKQDQQT